MEIYKSVTAFLSPVIRSYVSIVRRNIYKKEDIDIIRFQERFGIYYSSYINNRHVKQQPIWIHASSIGESMTALDIVNTINEHTRDVDVDNVLLTVGTVGARMAIENKYSHNKFNFQLHCIYAPIDIPNIVDLFFEYWKPSCGIFLESDLWPNLINGANNRSIPLALLNGRISENSYLKWKKYTLGKQLFENMILNFNTIQCQTDQDVQRFMKLGAIEENVKMFGNVKLIVTNNDATNSFEKERKIMREILLENNIMFTCVAGSTYFEDEEMIFQLHQSIRRSNKNVNQQEEADNKLITVIAPRKINRINAIEQVVKKNNLKYTLWSSIMNEDDNIIGDFDIILVDCFGILPFFYEYGHLIYVGGALTNNNSVGGHNFMEALNSCNNESIVCTGSYLGNNLESVIEILKKYNCKVPYKIKSNDDYTASLEEIYDIAQKKQASSLMKKMVNIEASSNSANVNAFANFKMKLIDEMINDLKMNGVISTRRI